MLRLGLEKLDVRRRLRAECLCGGLPFPTGFRVGAGVVPALADTSTARNKKTRINGLIDNKRHSGFGFGNEATVCCKTDGRIGNAASKVASSKVVASYRTPNQVLTMAKGTARGDPAASLAGWAAQARQNGAAEVALAQTQSILYPQASQHIGYLFARGLRFGLEPAPSTRGVKQWTADYMQL